MTKHKPCPYKYGVASETAKATFDFGPQRDNPMQEEPRLLPLKNLKVGEALFFHVSEMTQGEIQDARTLARRYSNKYNHFLGFIKHQNKALGYYMLEIVRIK